jgi:hypothetical protein
VNVCNPWQHWRLHEKRRFAIKSAFNNWSHSKVSVCSWWQYWISYQERRHFTDHLFKCYAHFDNYKVGVVKMMLDYAKTRHFDRVNSTELLIWKWRHSVWVILEECITSEQCFYGTLELFSLFETRCLAVRVWSTVGG